MMICVMLAQQGHNVFRPCTFGEPRKATQVAEQHGYLASMTFKLLLGARTQRSGQPPAGQEVSKSTHTFHFADLVGDALLHVLI
jgi:hypothetical protein